MSWVTLMPDSVTGDKAVKLGFGVPTKAPRLEVQVVFLTYTADGMLGSGV